jgi:hypothetical protein
VTVPSAPPPAETVDHTVVRPVPATEDSAHATGAPAVEETVRRSSAPPTSRGEATVVRTPVAVPPASVPAVDAAAPTADTARPPTRRALMWGLIVGAAAVVVVVVLVVASLVNAGAPSARKSTPPAVAPQDPISAVVAPVTDLKGAAGAGGVTFTWTNPDPHAGDAYLWNVDVPGQDADTQRTDKTSVTVPADAGGRTCVQVVVVRTDGTSSNETTGCAP